MSRLPDDAPSPRLCIIVKWPDFEGYGFNLHADKSKPGQYIGKVDDNSPAEAAGLRENDRIIEVNGANIANENHKQVVQRIKAVANETRLLVVDPQTDKYYKSKNIVVRGTQENVSVRSSARDQKRSATPEPQSQPAAAVSNGHHDEADNRSVSSAASSSATSEVSTQPQHATTTDELDKGKDATVEEASAHPPMEDEKSCSPSPPPVEEAKVPLDEAVVPQEDGASQSGSDKLSEKDANVASGESVPEVTVTSHFEEFEKSEEVLAEGDTPAEEETHEEEKEEKVEEEERGAEVTPPTAEPESDLEAEYDNVEIDAGRAAGAATQTSSDSRRLSASSGDSHSSHGSDTARTTDPHTQSPMSTSPTPPPSLEPASEPVRNSPSPKGSTTTTTTTTTTSSSNNTNNASPKPVSNNNNAYNSSGLNLNMSAAEMRAKLASKKKADPRKDTVDLKKKYEIIQNM